MKKCVTFLILCCFFLFCGCKTENPYLKYVSEVRSEIFYGKSENYEVSAFYGKKESPYINDGKVGDMAGILEFRIKNHDIDGVKRVVAFSFGGDEYALTLSVDEITGAYGAKTEIGNFSEKSFEITVICGAESETVVLNSEIPENALTFDAALNKLSENNGELLRRYENSEGVFDGEIRMRILLKDKNPYWYVGLCDKNGKLKALLIDGVTGETLAIREIF